MPKQPAAGLILGLQVTGDLAGVTYVQNKQGRRIVYAKTYPQRTPNHLQKYRRDRFREAVSIWREHTPEQKKLLDEITEHFQMCMSGYNLFLSCYLSNQLNWLHDYAQQIGKTWDGYDGTNHEDTPTAQQDDQPKPADM